MKVLYGMIYAPEVGGSGAPIYTHTLMEGMQQKGDTAGIVFSVHHSYQSRVKVPYALFPLYFDHPPVFDNQPKAVGSIPFHSMSQREVKEYIEAFFTTFEKCIQEDGYELLHIQHGMYIGYAAALIKEKYHVPYMISLHAMELNFLHEFPDPIFAMKAMTDADSILALSEAQKNRLLNEYTREIIIALDMKQKGVSRQESEERYAQIVGDRHIDPERIAVCPLGIDVDHYRIKPFEYVNGLKQFIAMDKPKLVMYAGRLIEMKGILNLLEAERLYNVNGDVHTVILGGGQYENFVGEITRVRPNVHYLGFKEQSIMPMYLNFIAEHKGVFTVPSSSEGMSLVYLEAMACGSRVLASCKKDMQQMDFMQHPYARFTNFGNIEELANAVTQMLADTPPHREDVRNNMVKYDIPSFQKRVYSLYEQCIA